MWKTVNRTPVNVRPDTPDSTANYSMSALSCPSHVVITEHAWIPPCTSGAHASRATLGPPVRQTLTSAQAHRVRMAGTVRITWVFTRVLALPVSRDLTVR